MYEMGTAGAEDALTERWKRAELVQEARRIAGRVFQSTLPRCEMQYTEGSSV